MISDRKAPIVIVLSAVAIGGIVGVVMSLIFNDPRDFSKHGFNGVVVAGMFAVVGGLIALARWRRRRSFVKATAVWASLIAAAWVFGGFTSLYTGEPSEIPKWNGWSYFFFCANDDAFTASILFTPPFVAIVLIFACMKLRRRFKKSQD